MLFHTAENEIRTFVCVSTGHNTRHPRFQPAEICMLLPDSALPTTTHPIRSLIRHTGTASILEIPRDASEDDWSTVVIEAPANLPELLEGIRQGTAVCVTDGSFKTLMGTAAFIVLPFLMAADGFVCCNMTPGDPAIVDAYRAELSGIFGCIRLLNRLAARFHLEGSITLGCDCASALNNLLHEWDPKPNRAHWDLLSAIRDQVKLSPLQWNFRHVKGHQDRLVRYDDLDRWGQLNVDMDRLAKLYWKMLDGQRPPPFSLEPPPGQWSVWHGSLRLSSWNRNNCMQTYYNPAVFQYWTKRGVHDPMHRIDWTAAAAALRMLSVPHRLWLPKWHSSLLPISSKLSKWYLNRSPNCPRCGDPELHRNHIVQCPLPSASTAWLTSLDKLTDHLDTSYTHPILRDLILSLLTAWYTGEDWHPEPIRAIDLDRLIQDQKALGIQLFVDGFWAPGWASVQDSYYKDLGRKTTGNRWAARVIYKIWQIPWNAWWHRNRFLDKIQDASLPAVHTVLDDRIAAAFTFYRNSPNPHFARWFSRPMASVQSEDVDWKEQWLEHVSTLSA